MTEEQREYVFTGMLSSTKDKGGLGSAIVAKVAEAHGGRVEVESAPADTDHPAATCIKQKRPAAA